MHSFGKHQAPGSDETKLMQTTGLDAILGE
jgi:hypothetical protein